MQRCSCVSFFAHWTNNYQVSLPIITNDSLPGGIGQFVISANVLPLADALGAEAVLALAALLRVQNHHLADPTHEVRIKLVLLRLLRGGLTFH